MSLLLFIKGDSTCPKRASTREKGNVERFYVTEKSQEL
ncbi:hypothetical protein SAMN05444673_5365 [Bacillus sp. OV166]|nr:hypothetical protein SAMN05444673_5365 [Bacillus sp. OV166]